MKRRVSLILVLALLMGILQFPVAAEEQPVQTTQQMPQIATRSWSGTVASGFSGGKGTEADPYYIADAKELAYLASSVNSGNTYSGKYIELVANIDLSGAQWTPIGSSTSAPFYGNFKGNGYTISGLQISTTTSTQPAGLFGVNYGTVSDLQLNISGISKNYAGITSQIANMGSGDYSIGARGAAVGGVAGVNYGTIRFVSVAGPVSAHYQITDTSGWRHIEIYLGGIAGVNESVISECIYNGTVSGSYYYGTGGLCIGGACGLLKNASVTNTITFGSIQVGDTSGMQTSYCVGGLVGSSKSSTIRQCGSSAAINVSAQDDYLMIGGLLGNGKYTTVESSYAQGQVSATVAGASGSSRQVAGGLIGETVQATINNCYTANPQVKMWATNDKATAAGKLVALAYDYDGNGNTAATKANNCYVSSSTSIVRKVKEGSGCNTSYNESHSGNYGEWTTDGFTASAGSLSSKLGWGTYTSLENTRNNPKNVWSFQNGRPCLYTEQIFSLTVRYYNEAGKLFDTYFAYYDPNVDYYVVSPTVSGSAPSPEAVSGTISADTFANVYYQHQHIPGEAATCTSEQRCVLCDVVMVEKLPHDYAGQVVAPTCEQSGYRVFTCVNCQDTYTDSFVRPAGHQLDQQNICTVCGASFTAPLQQYTVYVFDYKTEKPISGATVKLGDKTIKADTEGVAIFQLEKLGTAMLEVTATGYPTYTVREYMPTELQYDCVYLESVNAVINGAWCNGDNVTTGKTQINAQAHALTAKIVISGNSKDKILGYELVQDGVVIAKSEDGVFHVPNPTFKIKQDVYVRMHTEGADTVSVFQRKLNIEVVGFIFNFETDLKDLLPFSQGLKMSFPDGTPGFEGYELNIKNPFMENTKITYRHENDKVLVMMGFEKDYAEDPALKDMDTGELFKKLIDDWASEAKDDKKAEVQSSIALVVEYNHKGVTKAYGQINVGFHLQRDIGKTFMVGVIPIYGEIGLSLKGEMEISEIGYDRLNAQLLIPQFETKLGGAITMYAGVGCHVASVGVYGQVAVELVFSSDQQSAFEKGALTGELGVYAKLKLLFFKELSYKYPLLQGQITWPDHTRQLQKRIYSIDSYTTDARDYLMTRSAWYYATDNEADTYMLQQSAYTAIEPKLVTCGDTVMMLFLDDDGSEGLNYQQLYYTLYDKTTGGWRLPRRVDSNTSPDVEFDVYADGRDIYIAYTELESITEKLQDDYAGVLGTAEVVAARYDIHTDQFTEHRNLSANNTFDTLPKIGGTESGVTVAWVNNVSGDLFSQNANNTVTMASLTAQGWTQANAITAMGPTVVSMDVGILNGSSYVATVCDVDCDLSTLEDRVVRLTDLAGNTLQIPGTDSANDGVQFVRFQGEDRLLWYNGGNLYSVSAADEMPAPMLESAVESLTGSYKFLRVDADRYAILFTQNEQYTNSRDNTVNGSNVYGIFYSDGTWGKPIPVTKNAVGNYVDAYDACVDNGKIIIPYTSAETIITEENIVKHIDFMFASLEMQNDLIAGEAEFRPSDLFQGDTVAISVPVTNNSWQKVKNIAYAVKDIAGNVVLEGTHQQQINSGETEELMILLPKSVLVPGEDYSLSVSTSDWPERDLSNNTVALMLWYTDFSVNAAQMNMPGSKVLHYTVTNDGNISGDAILKVYKMAPDGKSRVAVSEDILVTNLGVGKTVNGTLPITEAYYEEGAEEGTVFLTAEPQKTELYKFNDTVVLSVGEEERNATTQIEEKTAAESPLVLQPYVAYDPILDGDISVTVDEKGWVFAGVKELPEEAYSYTNGVLRIYKDSLKAMHYGYHSCTLVYSLNDQTTEVLVLLEMIDSGYREVVLTVPDRVIKYDGGALKLGKDILYTTESGGQISCEYSADSGATWKTGLPDGIGEYRVRVTVARDDENRYLPVSATANITVEKGNRAISVPVAQGVFDLRMRFGNAVPTAGSTDGTILYGYSLTDDISTVANWSKTGVLPADHKDTTYYVFAKIVGGANYEDAYSLGYAIAKPGFEKGDVDCNGQVENADVVALLWNTLFPETYPIFVYADFNADQMVDNNDVVLLLWHTLFPAQNPLY